MRLTDAERETLLEIAREAMAATVVEEEYEVDEDLLTGNLKCLCGVFRYASDGGSSARLYRVR
jgi:hypothetical protein